MGRERRLERRRRSRASRADPRLVSLPPLSRPDRRQVAIPVKDAHGEVTLVLDFGRFVIDSGVCVLLHAPMRFHLRVCEHMHPHPHPRAPPASADTKTPAKLSPEEAALYECVRLDASDVAAFLVDGVFDWQEQQVGTRCSCHLSAATCALCARRSHPVPPMLFHCKQSSRLVPLLERTGMDIGLQAARFADPARPAIRLQPNVPVLHFYLRCVCVCGGGGGQLATLARALCERCADPRTPPRCTLIIRAALGAWAAFCVCCAAPCLPAAAVGRRP